MSTAAATLSHLYTGPSGAKVLNDKLAQLLAPMGGRILHGCQVVKLGDTIQVMRTVPLTTAVQNAILFPNGMVAYYADQTVTNDLTVSGLGANTYYVVARLAWAQDPLLQPTFHIVDVATGFVESTDVILALLEYDGASWDVRTYNYDNLMDGAWPIDRIGGPVGTKEALGMPFVWRFQSGDPEWTPEHIPTLHNDGGGANYAWTEYHLLPYGWTTRRIATADARFANCTFPVELYDTPNPGDAIDVRLTVMHLRTNLTKYQTDIVSKTVVVDSYAQFDKFLLFDEEDIASGIDANGGDGDMIQLYFKFESSSTYTGRIRMWPARVEFLRRKLGARI